MDPNRKATRKALAEPVPQASGSRWNEEDEAQASTFKALTREQAQALRAKDPPLSPWRVIVLQLVPGALMARGMTSRLSSVSPGASAVSVLLWSSVKILVSVAMLVVANRVVQPLVWPALLIGLVLCMKIYVVALLWRQRRPN